MQRNIQRKKATNKERKKERGIAERRCTRQC